MDQPPKPASAASETLSRISQRIKEDESVAYAEFVKRMQDSEDRQVPMLWFLGQRFDTHAYYHSFLVTDYQAITEWFEPYLYELRKYVIQEGEKILCNWRDAVAQKFRETLAVHLLGRLHYWKAETMKRARTFEDKASRADQVAASSKVDLSQSPPYLPPAAEIAGPPADQPRGPLEAQPPLALRLDEAVARLDITHEELARRIGIGKTTYFAVKGGAGKRSARLKVERYLRKLNESEPI